MRVQAVAQLADARCDLIECDGLRSPVALDDVHGCRLTKLRRWPAGWRWNVKVARTVRQQLRVRHSPMNKQISIKHIFGKTVPELVHVQTEAGEHVDVEAL